MLVTYALADISYCKFCGSVPKLEGRGIFQIPLHSFLSLLRPHSLPIKKDKWRYMSPSTEGRSRTIIVREGS